MKLTTYYAIQLGTLIVLGGIGAVQCATNEPPSVNYVTGKVFLSPMTNDNLEQLAPPTKLQSVEAAKTNAPVPRVEQSGNSGSFEEGVIFGALAFARNPDVRDPKVIVEIARGLWQAQKRADAQRQTNAPSK